MTQIDLEALKAARRVFNATHLSVDAQLCSTITAYLAALPPPTGEVGKMVKRLHDASDVPTKFCDTYHVHQYRLGLHAADALTTLSARLASRDREISALMDKADNFERAAVANYRRAEAAEARLAECERDLESRKNYTDADYVRLHKAHCMTADKLASATARTERMAAEMERIADLTERWTDSLVSQVNEIARAALSNGDK